jgi:hypothetical protein
MLAPPDNGMRRITLRAVVDAGCSPASSRIHGTGEDGSTRSSTLHASTTLTSASVGRPRS